MLRMVSGQRNTTVYPRPQAAETLALAGVLLITKGFEVTQAEKVCHKERITPGNLQRYLLFVLLNHSKDK